MIVISRVMIVISRGMIVISRGMIVISRGMIVTSRGMTFPPGIERGCIGRMKGDERRRSKRLCVANAQSIQRRHVGIGALLNLLRLCLSKAKEGIDEDFEQQHGADDEHAERRVAQR
jgi:hypothetical protein